MYYYEKDYIMRLIHGIAQVLAYLYFGKKMENEGKFSSVMDEAGHDENEYLRKLIDGGQINTAEDRLFELVDSSSWSTEQLGVLFTRTRS